MYNVYGLSHFWVWAAKRKSAGDSGQKEQMAPTKITFTMQLYVYD